MLTALLAGPDAYPCSRVVFQGRDSLTVVGRTLDWRTPIPTNLYVYPRGMQKSGMPSGNTLHWTAKYGSVLAVSYDGGVTEGMNEMGLVMNGLFCKGTVYTASHDGRLPVMSLAVLVSYFLDNFATVVEVEKWLAETPFAIYGQSFDKGTTAALHWAVTDRSGMTLVMEYRDGKLNTCASRDYRVLTNDPPFGQMLAIERTGSRWAARTCCPGRYAAQTVSSGPRSSSTTSLPTQTTARPRLRCSAYWEPFPYRWATQWTESPTSPLRSGEVPPTRKI